MPLEIGPTSLLWQHKYVAAATILNQATSPSQAVCRARRPLFPLTPECCGATVTLPTQSRPGLPRRHLGQPRCRPARQCGCQSGSWSGSRSGCRRSWRLRLCCLLLRGAKFHKVVRRRVTCLGPGGGRCSTFVAATSAGRSRPGCPEDSINLRCEQYSNGNTNRVVPFPISPEPKSLPLKLQVKATGCGAESPREFGIEAATNNVRRPP